jgi:hypothetical protein
MCKVEKIMPEGREAPVGCFFFLFFVRLLLAIARRKLTRRFLVGPVLRFQWEDAKSDTGEADLAIVQYWQYFRECNHLVYMDDGDGLPICLLHAFERLQNGTFCGKEFWICKPRKGTTKKIQCTAPAGAVHWGLFCEFTPRLNHKTFAFGSRFVVHFLHFFCYS